jgi:hypothetical protein
VTWRGLASSQRLQEMCGTISRGAGEHPIPLPQRLTHSRTGREQFLDLGIHGVQYALRFRSDVVTRLPARVSGAQESRDFSERKPEPLGVAHHVQPVDDRLRIEPVSGGCPLWSGQQPEPFVVADRARADTTQFGKLTNRQEAVHWRMISVLDLEVDFKVYDGRMKTLLLTLVTTLVLAITLSGRTVQHPTMPPGMTHEEHLRELQKDAELKRRGAAAMGFDQDSTTHHFRLTAKGGAIEVTLKDPLDAAGLEQIRSHLREITGQFAAGDFATPLATHGEVPPGVSMMQDRKTAIAYAYEDITVGGRVRIVTADATALEAVHDFLRYQIREHATGDPLTITK